MFGLLRHTSASKTAIKRVFLITDQDNPHPGEGGTQLSTSARTTLVVGVRLGNEACAHFFVGFIAGWGHDRTILHLREPAVRCP